ncbi:MAG: hypothetical protein EA383_13945 [Spirochaetaceae bacterium]|nr:MAG: hypothetical protein EA383_13945 [Spirochaetaceae bacterium]
MRIVVFAPDESTRDIFRSFDRKDTVTLEYMHHDEIRTWVKSGHSADILYLDVRELTARDCSRLLKRLAGSGSGALAVIDVDDEIDDVGRLYFDGACDYVNSHLCDEGLKPSRVEAALRYHHQVHHQVEPSADLEHKDYEAQTKKTGSRTRGDIPPDFPSTACAIPRLIPSSRDWSGVCEGEEYTFGLLYVGVDLEDAVRKDTRPELVRDSIEAFRSAVSEAALPYNGKLWFWKEHAGVVLFPFDGVSSDAVTGTIQLALRGMFWQAETRTNYLTEQYRLALHVGNIVFQQGGRRETLVSDTINYLFHLGSMHAGPGEFIATEPVLSRCPEGFRHCFVPHDSFKGVKTWRMRRILRPE